MKRTNIKPKQMVSGQRQKRTKMFSSFDFYSCIYILYIQNYVCKWKPNLLWYCLAFPQRRTKHHNWRIHMHEWVERVQSQWYLQQCWNNGTVRPQRKTQRKSLYSHDPGHLLDFYLILLPLLILLPAFDFLLWLSHSLNWHLRTFHNLWNYVLQIVFVGINRFV